MMTSNTALGPRPGRFRAASDQLLGKAVGDLIAGLRQWRIWILLSWHDIKQRYRGSLLGPFWLTISMGVMIGSMAVVYGSLFREDVTTYVPNLTCGFIAWGLILASISEGCVAFISNDALIRQIRLPLSVFVYRVACRNAIVMAHNFVIYVIVIVALGQLPGWISLLALVGIAGVMVSLLWAILIFGMLCARFRDVNQIIANVMQVAFFLTPIIWRPEALNHSYAIVSANPFYHFIEVIRAPLLGQLPTATNWIVVGMMGLFGWILAIALYRPFRSRIAFWV